MTSDPPPPTNLCDLPLELVGLIAERIPDTESRCALGKCCKSYRELMKNIKVVSKELTVIFGPEQSVWIQFKWKTDVCYFDQDGKCCIQRRNAKKRWYVKVLQENYLEVALNDLMTILQNPKLIVKRLTFVNDDLPHLGPFIELLQQKLNGLDHTLHVETAKFEDFNEDEIMKIMPFYTPGTLRELVLEMKRKEDPFTKIFNLAQWKQAKRLWSNVIEPLDEILHFKEVEFLDWLPERKSIPWDQFKSFLDKLIAQADHTVLQFHGFGFKVPIELEEYTENMERLGQEGRRNRNILLKRLENGTLVMMESSGYFGIHKFVNGQLSINDLSFRGQLMVPIKILDFCNL